MPDETVLLDTQEMKIKYNGGNTIEANTYINSLIHFTNVVQDVNKSLSKTNKIEVHIKANDKGSFIVDLIVQCVNFKDEIKGIFTKDHISYAKEVISTVGEVYKVAKHLMGSKPKTVVSDKDATIKIENNNGNVQVFDYRGATIYMNNPAIQEAISQEFETLEADVSVTGLEFIGEGDTAIVEIERKEFYSLSTTGSNREALPNERTVPMDATLNLSSLDLDFKKKWDFYYSGNKISAKVNDSALVKGCIPPSKYTPKLKFSLLMFVV
jgi:hypothetical protein